MSRIDGPAVQRPTLEGTHVAQVTIGGATAIIHSFNDPLLVRGISRQERPGHSYAQVGQVIVHIDIPIEEEGLAGEITINVTDLSKVRLRPTRLEEVQSLLDATPRSLRPIGRITTQQLMAHPDWAALDLPGTAQTHPSGHYEIYTDGSKKFRWRLRRPDGRIIAESGQAYPNRADCEADLRWVKRHGAHSPIQSLDVKSPSPRSPERK
jgi:uncharacterized protein YegP (UPF0339 family)